MRREPWKPSRWKQLSRVSSIFDRKISWVIRGKNRCDTAINVVVIAKPKNVTKKRTSEAVHGRGRLRWSGRHLQCGSLSYRRDIQMKSTNRKKFTTCKGKNCVCFKFYLKPEKVSEKRFESYSKPHSELLSLLQHRVGALKYWELAHAAAAPQWEAALLPNTQTGKHVVACFLSGAGSC